MPNTKISALTSGAPRQNADALPIARAGNNFRLAVSDLISFTQSGSGATVSDFQTKGRQIVSVRDFGAVGDGVTDDSAAFVAAFAASNTVIGVGNDNYNIKNITLTNNQTFDGRGCKITSGAAATFIFKLTNFAATVKNIYVASASTCSEAAITFDNGRFCSVMDCFILNATTAFKLKATVALTGCVKPRISRVHVETFTTAGIDLAPNVLQLEATDVFLDAAGAGGIGVKHVSTGSVIAYGGHTYSNVRSEGCSTGWILTDATLTEINGGWADNCSGIGFRVTGATDNTNLNDFFIGTCNGGGLTVENTSVFYVNGLQTFAAVDTVRVLNTARLFMNLAGWRGSKASFSVASGAVFTATGGPLFTAGSAGNVAVSTTTYLGQNGVQASEADTVWRAPDDGYLLGVYAVASVTPVTTHTYTARVGAADTAIVATMTAGNFSAQSWGAVSVTKGQAIDVKLVSSTTNASAHQVILFYCVN